VPIICIVIGEGGSGGALGIGVGDKFAILEYAYYSVISPEGCAAILWRDGKAAEQAADALKLTSKELQRLGLADAIIAEPLGGAHRNIHDTVYNVEQYIVKTLRELKRTKLENLLDNRYKKLRAIGTAATMIEEEELRKPPVVQAAEKFLKAGKVKQVAEVKA
jgi:acetyl-CoA carboxylase carboxyl transferase subunit alpha